MWNEMNGIQGGTMLDNIRRSMGLLRLVVLACAIFALSGCAGTTNTQWIEAPLVADANLRGGVYTPVNPDGLHIGVQQQAVVQFSLATLPNAHMVDIFSDPKQAPMRLRPSNYVLTADKVARARLVVYVENVRTPGSIALVPLEGSGCWNREDTAPTCQDGQPVPGIDPDDVQDPNRGPIWVSQPGYRSFDVTDIVKSWIDGSRANNGIKIVSVAGANSSYADFDITAKESTPGKTLAPHSVQLLITLSDATGMSTYIRSSTEIRESQPDSNGIDVANLQLGGAVGNRSVALLQMDDLTLEVKNAVAMIWAQGTSALFQASLVTYASSSPPAATLRLSPTTQDFDASSVSWNTKPAWDDARAATASVSNSGVVSVFDISSNFAQSVVDQINPDPLDVVKGPVLGYRAALASDAVFPLAVDGVPNATTARAPRTTIVYQMSPVLAGWIHLLAGVTLYDVDDIGPWSIQTQYLKPAYAARLGHQFDVFGVQLMRYFPGGASGYLAVPIMASAPSTGASAIFNGSGRNAFEQMGGRTDGIGIFPTANRVAGSYLVSVTLPGHNVRLDVPFTNLPLPAPALQGPATVALPVGQNSVSLPATSPVDATAGFVLVVDDAIANRIDDTTQWKISSSVAGDTMPGVIAQTDGSVGFPIGFASTGPRTLTVVSKGDGSVTATMQTTVQQQSLVQMEQPSASTAFTYGQQIVLVGHVTAGANPVGRVRFVDGATILGEAALDGVGKATLAIQLPAGTHDIQAVYEGDVASFTLPALSSTTAIEVVRASTTITLNPRVPIGLGHPAMVSATLAVVAPGAGTPTGTITIVDTTDGLSCSYAAGASTPGCLIQSPSAGTKMLMASYAGDSNFLASTSATGALVVEAKPVPAPLSRELLAVLAMLLASCALVSRRLRDVGSRPHQGRFH